MRCNAKRSFRELDAGFSIRIFFRALHPQKGLHVDHVPRTHRGDVASDLRHHGQQRLVDRPAGTRFIVELMSATTCGFTRHGRLEKEVQFWLRHKSKDGRKRPGQNPRLSAWQPIEGCDPAGKAYVERLRSVQKIEQRRREGLCARRASDRIAKRHLLERKKKVGAGFYGACQPCDLSKLPAGQKPSKTRFAQRLLPAQVSVPLIIPLPCKIGLVAEATREGP